MLGAGTVHHIITGLMHCNIIDEIKQKDRLDGLSEIRSYVPKPRPCVSRRVFLLSTSEGGRDLGHEARHLFLDLLVRL